MPEIILFDYRDGLAFYEEFRPSLLGQTKTGRVYATGITIVLNSGLLYFLDKFKRKGFTSSQNFAANIKEIQVQHELPDADTQELVYVLAGMMRSVGKLYGTAKRKDYA